MLSPSTTPKVDRVVSLRDGRDIASAEWGPPDGAPVVLFHGMPGSRLFCPDEEATERAGVRLITIDRPGYGMSSPRPGRTLLDWAADYAEWADLVGLPPCPIVGWSAGGPYALACAARQPERVTSIALAASTAPWDAVPNEWANLPDEVHELIGLLRRDVPAAMDAITARCRWYEAGWATMFDEAAGTADGALLAEPRVLEAALAWMREGARHGVSGYVEDWVADALPWGFSPSEVSQETHLWWGDDDRFVGRESAEYLAGTIENSTVTVLADEGHLFPVRHWAAMLAALG